MKHLFSDEGNAKNTEFQIILAIDFDIRSLILLSFL
jgi:hypothetical protein